jgi:hypothetical protein
MPSSPDDITLIRMTVGRSPQAFTDLQASHLTDYKMLTSSRLPGADIHDTYPQGYENIYRQMMLLAKMATTPYVGVVEDDCLYPKEHFLYRPPLDTFAYNTHRWSLFTWGPAIYSIRNRLSNCSLIAPRLLLIEAIEERFAKHPTWPPQFAGELGRKRVEEGLGVTPRKCVEFQTEQGIIQINHEQATEDRQRRRRKTLGQVKAYDIPLWGKAEEVRSLWKYENIN